MTPADREIANEKFKAKNARRKAAKTACPNLGRRAEARAARRSYNGVFGHEKFPADSGLEDLIYYGTSKG